VRELVVTLVMIGRSNGLMSGLKYNTTPLQLESFFIHKLPYVNLACMVRLSRPCHMYKTNDNATYHI